MPTYIEGDAICIEFSTGCHDMLCMWEVGDIGVQGGVTNGVTNAKRIKNLRKFQTKCFSTYFNIKYVEPIKILIFLHC